MHILHVTRDFPPLSKGGLSTAVQGLTAALVNAGHTCSVISFDAWRPKGAAAVQAEPLAVTQRDSVCVLRISSPEQLEHAQGFALRSGCDVVHVHHGMLWPFAERLRSEAGMPVAFMVHVHQAMMNKVRGVHERTASLEGQERALCTADLVLTPSHACREALLLEHPNVPVTATPLGIHGAEVAHSAAAAQRDASNPVVLYVGRFGDVKGTQAFFELAVRLLRERPSLRVRIAGGVPGNPKAERRWLRRWRSLCPSECDDRVDFLGWLDSESLTVHYRDANLLVIPSWTETFGLSALEGMLHGVAIVASDCPALQELLTSEGNALLYPSADREALFQQVNRLLDEPEFARRLATQAARDARTHYLWEHQISAYLSAYRELVGSEV